MKSKILIALPIIIILVFGVNWGYGNVTSKKLDKQLMFRIENSNLPVKFGYQKVKVNPLFSEIAFYSVKLILMDGTASVTSEKVVVNMPYSDAIELSETNSLQEIESFEFEMINSIIESDNKEVSVENLLLDYDGQLTRGEVANWDSQFPDNKQNLFCRVKNVKLLNQDILKDIDFLLSKDGSVIDETKFNLMFDPEEREIALTDFVVKNKAVKLNADIELDYEGAGMNDFSPVKVVFDYDSSNGSEKIEWGDPEITGRFSVKKFQHKYKGVLKRNSADELSLSNIENAQMKFIMEDLNIDYEGNAKQRIENQLSMLGIHADDVVIQKFSFNSEVKNGVVSVSDTKLVSPLIKANLEADIRLDEANVKQSNINHLKLVIDGLAPELDQKVNELALAFNITIPRENGKIILDVTGTFGKPHIKGVN